MEMLVSAYLDNEVTEQERKMVEQHLPQCPECQAMLVSFARIQTLYRELDVKEAPRDFRQHVTQRLDQQSSRWFSWHVPRLVYAFSFALLILLGGFMATRSLWWIDMSSDSGDIAQTIDIYAEDVLFGETAFVLDEIFAIEDVSLAEDVEITAEDMEITDETSFSDDTGIAEEILNSINFSESDTSYLKNESVGTGWLAWATGISRPKSLMS